MKIKKIFQKNWLVVAILSLSFLGLNAQTTKFFDEADEFFSTYVANGKVDYKSINANPDLLNSALTSCKKTVVSTADSATYQAFWINAYNLAVIKGIVDNYPLNSPLDCKGFFDELTYDLGGTSITLNDIENKMLRAKIGDARHHFVLVCGAKGCPPLLSRAYRPEDLESLLERQTIKALNDSSFIRVSENEVFISEIFKWYKEDFVKGGTTQIEYLNKYREVKVPLDSKLSYYSYDWQVNSK